MGAWVATVLRDLFHHVGRPFSPPAAQPAGGTRTGIALANASSGCMTTGNGIDRNKYQGVTGTAWVASHS
jgi:hypothetical protein